MTARPTTWILTGSPKSFAATRERGFTVIGARQGRRDIALTTGARAGAPA
jgi:hypothetical protein